MKPITFFIFLAFLFPQKLYADYIFCPLPNAISSHVTKDVSMYKGYLTTAISSTAKKSSLSTSVVGKKSKDNQKLKPIGLLKMVWSKGHVHCVYRTIGGKLLCDMLVLTARVPDIKGICSVIDDAQCGVNACYVECK